MVENTQDWLQLNWVKNHTRFYFSASHLGHPDQPGHKKRDSFEVLKPDTQCKKALECMGKLEGQPGYHSNLKLEYGVTECYISGLKITEKGGLSMKTPAGHQCEHVLTASTIAMLTGLPSPMYKTECSEILEELRDGSSMDHRYSEFISRYETFQEELWPLLYDWSHPACNEFKDNHPFLKINFRLKGLKVIPTVYTSNNIKKLLAILFYSHVDPTIDTKLSKWREEVVNKQLPSGSDLNQYVQDRYESIYQKIQGIEDKINSYNKTELKHYSYLSTKTMLNVIIHKVLQHGPFKWVKPLHRMFKKTTPKLKEYIEREANTKLKVPLTKLMNFMKTKTGGRGIKGGGKDELLYYDTTNLTMDVIYGALMMLSLDPVNSDLFKDMGIDSMMVNLHEINIEEFMGPSDNEELLKFKKFCEFFRYYMNSENTIKYILDPELYTLDEDSINRNFKMEVISITNYIWNVYSSYYKFKEAIIDGSSNTLDELSSGPKLDEHVLEYSEIINIMKLLESMGNDLTDDVIKSKKSIPQHKEPEQETKLKPKHRIKKRTLKKNKGDTAESRQILRSMKFMVGNKEVLF